MKNIFDKIEIGKIIGKYITGKESDKDLETLTSWLNHTPKNQSNFKVITDEKEIQKNIEEIENFNVDRAWKNYKEKVAVNAQKKQILTWKIAAVFIFLLGISGSLITYWSANKEEPIPVPVVYTTIVTENGETSKIILPDSSIVWLNSGTTLSYNNNFSVNNRDIRMQGEAYFNVKRNESIPLIVHFNEMEVKVLGTEFDLSTYPEDSEISVVLEKGSIELSHVANKFKSFTLRPGEIARFNETESKLVVSNIDTYEHVSWKDGVLIFNNAAMKEVFSKLERWYGVNIIVDDTNVYDLIFNATIVDENLEDIFRLIKYTCDINYKITYSHHPLEPVKIEVSMNK
ncbi:MAG: FecR family protein [Draconibacterium sp.]